MREFIVIMSTTIKAKTKEQAEAMANEALRYFDKALGKSLAVHSSAVDDCLETEVIA